MRDTQFRAVGEPRQAEDEDSLHDINQNHVLLFDVLVLVHHLRALDEFDNLLLVHVLRLARAVVSLADGPVILDESIQERCDVPVGVVVVQKLGEVLQLLNGLVERVELVGVDHHDIVTVFLAQHHDQEQQRRAKDPEVRRALVVGVLDDDAEDDHANSPHDDGVLGVEDLRVVVVEVDGAFVEREELDDGEEGYDDHDEDAELGDVEQREAEDQDDFEDEKFEVVPARGLAERVVGLKAALVEGHGDEAAHQDED